MCIILIRYVEILWRGCRILCGGDINTFFAEALFRIVNLPLHHLPFRNTDIALEVGKIPCVRKGQFILHIEMPWMLCWWADYSKNLVTATMVLTYFFRNVSAINMAVCHGVLVKIELYTLCKPSIYMGSLSLHADIYHLRNNIGTVIYLPINNASRQCVFIWERWPLKLQNVPFDIPTHLYPYNINNNQTTT